MHWEITIDHQDQWWKIQGGSPTSGSLDPGEYEYVYIETDPNGLPDGEYTGYFTVESHGNGYSLDTEVKLTLIVGAETEPEGPELINVSTNTGPMPDKIRLSFDKTLDSEYANNLRNYYISPSIPITGVSVSKDQVVLQTDTHCYETVYTVTVETVKDLNGTESTNLTANYQFYPCCAGPDLQTTGTEENYEWDNALPGKWIYTDRNVTLVSVPPGFDTCAMLRTSYKDGANDKVAVTFPVNCEAAKVYLAFDPDVTDDWNCDWFRQNYTKLDTILPIKGTPTNDHLMLYESKATYRAGEIVQLGQVGAPGSYELMYTVLVRETEPKASISGAIQYYASPCFVSATQVLLDGIPSDSMVTDTSGTYTFSSLDGNQNYVIRPTKTGDVPKATILMHDASVAAQIAQGMLAASVNQNIAADANEDSAVTMADAMAIARYAVGLPLETAPELGAWRYNPPHRIYANLDSSLQNQDFSAIVIGDADGNWGSAQAANRTTIYKNVTFNNQIILKTRDDLLLKISPEINVPISSFYVELEFQEQFEYYYADLNNAFSDFQLLVNKKQKGMLKIGCFTVQKVEFSGEFLNLHFQSVSENPRENIIKITKFFVNGESILANSEIVSAGEKMKMTRLECILLPNYPNPFNPATTIFYELRSQQAMPINLAIYNIRGERVKILVEARQTAGCYAVQWNGMNQAGYEVASGIYWAILKTAGNVETRKLLKIK